MTMSHLVFTSINLHTILISKHIERLPREDARHLGANLDSLLARLDVDEVAIVLRVTDDIDHFS